MEQLHSKGYAYKGYDIELYFFKSVLGLTSDTSVVLRFLWAMLRQPGTTLQTHRTVNKGEMKNKQRWNEEDNPLTLTAM